jgi:hypothetical protein
VTEISVTEINVRKTTSTDGTKRHPNQGMQEDQGDQEDTVEMVEAHPHLKVMMIPRKTDRSRANQSREHLFLWIF